MHPDTPDPIPQPDPGAATLRVFGRASREEWLPEDWASAFAMRVDAAGNPAGPAWARIDGSLWQAGCGQALLVRGDRALPQGWWHFRGAVVSAQGCLERGRRVGIWYEVDSDGRRTARRYSGGSGEHWTRTWTERFQPSLASQRDLATQAQAREGLPVWELGDPLVGNPLLDLRDADLRRLLPVPRLPVVADTFQPPFRAERLLDPARAWPPRLKGRLEPEIRVSGLLNGGYQVMACRRKVALLVQATEVALSRTTAPAERLRLVVRLAHWIVCRCGRRSSGDLALLHAVAAELAATGEVDRLRELHGILAGWADAVGRPWPGLDLHAEAAAIAALLPKESAE